MKKKLNLEMEHINNLRIYSKIDYWGFQLSVSLDKSLGFHFKPRKQNHANRKNKAVDKAKVWVQTVKTKTILGNLNHISTSSQNFF